MSIPANDLGASGNFGGSIGSNKTPNGSPTYKNKSLGQVLGTVDEKYETSLMNIQTSELGDRGQSLNQAHMQYENDQKRLSIQQDILKRSMDAVGSDPIPDLVISMTDKTVGQTRSRQADRTRSKKLESKVSLRVNMPAQIHDRNFDPYAHYGKGRDDDVDGWRDNAEIRAQSEDELSNHLQELV